MLLAASYRTTNPEELFRMHPLDRAFLSYWMRQKEFDQMEQVGRLLGVMFDVGEVRGWGKQDNEGGALGLDDTENLLVPLAFMLRPESREQIQKMVGAESGLALPQGYRKQNGEVIVDLGKVDPETFKQFIEQNRVHTLNPASKG